MEYANHLNEYAPAWSEAQVAEEVARIRAAAKGYETDEVYRLCYSAIDLTTLSCSDSVESVTAFARKAVEFYTNYPAIANVASICIYPPFVETVGLAVDDTPMRITSVAGGFPSSQTFLEVKMLETAMAVENGADEIDIVINVGKMLEGHYDEVANEVEVLRGEAGEDVVLKVILETGELKTIESVFNASLIGAYAGADFIKTSTGKVPVNATPETVYVICEALRQFHAQTGKMVGIKVAGGITKIQNAIRYLTIVKHILGEQWLTPAYFRIGTSQLLEDVLKEMKTVKING